MWLCFASWVRMHGAGFNCGLLPRGNADAPSPVSDPDQQSVCRNMKSNTHRKATLAIALTLACLTLPALAYDRYQSRDGGENCVPEPTSILAGVMAAGAVAGGLFLRRGQK